MVNHERWAEPPAETGSDGQAPYPTYHDRPGDPPPPVERRRRGTPWIPIFIGVVLFGLVLLFTLVGSGVGLFESAGETPSTTGPAAPAGREPIEPGLDRNVEPDSATGPGAVGSRPGAVDVPGGSVTQPAEPAQPQQGQ